MLQKFNYNSRVMEAETIQKNAARPKSLTNRRNFREQEWLDAEEAQLRTPGLDEESQHLDDSEWWYLLPEKIEGIDSGDLKKLK
jgi:hypothetical protein